jgi:predicted Zn-dependent peptidase
LERSHLLGMESLGLRNSLNGERLVFGIDYLSSEAILERLRAVDRCAVERVARQVASNGAPALSLVGPLKKAKGLRKAIDMIAKA